MHNKIEENGHTCRTNDTHNLNSELVTPGSESQKNNNCSAEPEYKLFKNQVGGHHSILCPKACNDYIIKPAIKKEL